MFARTVPLTTNSPVVLSNVSLSLPPNKPESFKCIYLLITAGTVEELNAVIVPDGVE